MRKVAMILVMAALLVGCSSSDNNGNNANNNQGNETTPLEDAGGNGTDVDNAGAEYDSSYAYVFDHIEFLEQPGRKLNNLLNSNMDLNLDHPVLIMLVLSQIDTDAGTMYIEGGSGRKTDTDNEYSYNPDAEIDGMDGTINADTGHFEAQLPTFNFVATFQTEDGPITTILPIKDLAVSGNIQFNDDDTTEVVNGTLAGYLTKEDGDNTTIAIVPGGEPTPLTVFFQTAMLNYNTTTGARVEAGSTDADAWYLNGVFTARETTLVN